MENNDRVKKLKENEFTKHVVKELIVLYDWGMGEYLAEKSEKGNISYEAELMMALKKQETLDDIIELFKELLGVELGPECETSHERFKTYIKKQIKVLGLLHKKGLFDD